MSDCYNVVGEPVVEYSSNSIYQYYIQLESATPLFIQDTLVHISYPRGTAVFGTHFVGPTSAIIKAGTQTIIIDVEILACDPENNLVFDIEVVSEASELRDQIENCQRSTVTILSCIVLPEDEPNSEECVFTKECCVKFYTEGHNTWSKIVTFEEPAYPGSMLKDGTILEE